MIDNEITFSTINFPPAYEPKNVASFLDFTPFSTPLRMLKGSVIVFVDKQEAADELCKTLISASYSSLPLHGGIDQYDRDSTMSDFKSGVAKILIATSVAARGLDVKSLILVG